MRTWQEESFTQERPNWSWHSIFPCSLNIAVSNGSHMRTKSLVSAPLDVRATDSDCPTSGNLKKVSVLQFLRTVALNDARFSMRIPLCSIRIAFTYRAMSELDIAFASRGNYLQDKDEA
jgi:hypothetical protein